MNIAENLKKVRDENQEWLELRYHHRDSLKLQVKNGSLTDSISTTLSGVAVRALVNGSWGFVSTSDLTLEGLRKAADEAIKAAREAGSIKENRIQGLAEIEPVQGRFDLGEEDHNSREEPDLAGKIKLLMEADAEIRKAGEDITASQIAYSEIKDRKIIVTYEGTEVEIIDPKCDIGVVAFGERENQQERAHTSHGVTGSWVKLFAERTLSDLADKAVELVRKRLEADYVSGGQYQVILDPALVGVLAHEAIGHTVEADFVESGSVVQGRIGERVASELVTLVDEGNIADAAGRVIVDDEGVKTSRTTIIEGGVLKNYLHNRESALKFETKPGGNARAFTYRDEPLIRMTNTYILPGESDLDEMIAGIADGFFLKGLAQGGQADSTAEFMFDVLEAYRIEEGKIGKPVKGLTLSGQAFEVLKSVDAVSSDFEFGLGRGYCGKGQAAKVDAGGPYLCCRVMIGGQQ